MCLWIYIRNITLPIRGNSAEMEAEVLLNGSHVCAGRQRTHRIPAQPAVSSGERGGGESSVAANVAKAIYLIRDPVCILGV